MAVLHESTPVWLPDYAIPEAKPIGAAAAITLAVALAHELSGEAEMDRNGKACLCAEHAQFKVSFIGEDTDALRLAKPRSDREKRYVDVIQRRFNGSVNRCC